MHRYVYTHGGYTVVPFGVRSISNPMYAAAAHFARDGQLLSVTLIFPDEEFESEAAARLFAEKQANAKIDAGEVPVR
jgi:hypothetical protein